MRLLKQLTEQGMTLSAHAGPSYAPTVMAAIPIEGSRTPRKGEFVKAMHQLLADKKICLVDEGSPSRPRTHIRLPASDQDERKAKGKKSNKVNDPIGKASETRLEAERKGS